jgi:hypothetical protein
VFLPAGRKPLGGRLANPFYAFGRSAAVEAPEDPELTFTTASLSALSFPDLKDGACSASSLDGFGPQLPNSLTVSPPG